MGIVPDAMRGKRGDSNCLGISLGFFRVKGFLKGFLGFKGFLVCFFFKFFFRFFKPGFFSVF